MTERNSVPFHMALSRQGCDVLDLVSVEYFGKPLIDLAEEDPIEAYRFLCQAMKVVFSLKPATDARHTFENGSTISSEQDGDAAVLAANKALEAELTSVIMQPIDVTLYAMKTDDDEGGAVLQFTVEPLDYAF